MTTLLVNPNGDRKIPTRVHRGFSLYEREHARLVQTAKRSVLVAVPFITRQGWNWLSSNLEANDNHPAVSVLVRTIDSPPDSAWLKERRVKIRTYHRASGTGFYTFHFKCTVRDNDLAIIGSQNLNTSSLDSNLEMGVMLEGLDARRMVRLLRRYWEAADSPAMTKGPR